jgi:ribonuclease HI
MKTKENSQMSNSMRSNTSTTNQLNQDSQTHGNNSMIVYCDGAGSRPDGKGSGFAWMQPQTGERHVEHHDGLTNNQAEYRALISALTFLPEGSAAQVFTDSELMWSQVNGNYHVRDTELSELLSQVHTLIEKNNLTIDLQWVPRNKNLAGKLL